MIAVAHLLNPFQPERTPQAIGEVATVFAHLANPKRRALIRAIGYDSVPERRLKVAYGPSWGAVQADLRALVGAGLVEVTTSGRTVYLSLDLAAFPAEMLRGLLPSPVAVSTRRRRVLPVAA